MINKLLSEAALFGCPAILSVTENL